MTKRILGLTVALLMAMACVDPSPAKDARKGPPRASNGPTRYDRCRGKPLERMACWERHSR